MLLRRQNYEYSFWFSALFATVVSASFLLGISSMVCGRDQVLVEDSLLYPEVGEVKIWRSLSKNSPLAVRWRRYNPNPFIGKEAQKLYFFDSKLKRL